MPVLDMCSITHFSDNTAQYIHYRGGLKQQEIWLLADISVVSAPVDVFQKINITCQIKLL
jgi:hypothetical protein